MFHLILLLTRWILVAVFVGGLSFPAGAVTVSNTDDSGAGSLRQAIIDATDGDTINFSLAANSTITLTSEITIDNSLTIDGSGTSGLVISSDDADSDGHNDSRVFYISSGTTVTINNLTIADGYADYGGGIYNDGGRLNVTNCTISNNNSSSIGGGIKNTGTLTVINSTISGNTAASIGGGILNYGSAATLIVNNSKFDGNTATEGGGIYNEGSLDIIDSSFATNTVTSLGGGIANFRATATVKSSTFA